MLPPLTSLALSTNSVCMQQFWYAVHLPSFHVIVLSSPAPTMSIRTDRPEYTPANPLLRGILSLFGDENSADVIFDVGGQETFHAHRSILKGCAPQLAEYCDGIEDTPVPITGVEPDIFRHLLYYVYGGALPIQVLSNHSRDIINACNVFGIGHLKVEAEGWYVKSTPITLDNFVDNLHFSDTKKLALLKETVMSFLLEHEEEALNKISEQDVPQSESMLTDILTALAQKKRKRKRGDFQFKTMPINDMREMLEKSGLDIDGTRDMLIHDLEKRYNGEEGAVVESSTIPEFNGFYEVSSAYDSAPTYKKTGKYCGEEVDFTIWRRPRSDTNREQWCISIVPSGHDPNSDDAIDFFSADSESTTKGQPPMFGWVALYSHDNDILSEIRVTQISAEEDSDAEVAGSSIQLTTREVDTMDHDALLRELQSESDSSADEGSD